MPLTSSSWPRSVADSLKSPIVKVMRGVTRRWRRGGSWSAEQGRARRLVVGKASTPGALVPLEQLAER
jgi:hypothetical protein